MSRITRHMFVGKIGGSSPSSMPWIVTLAVLGLAISPAVAADAIYWADGAETAPPFIGAIRGFIKGLQGENRLAWAQRQTYLALGNGINGAKALGFDSCPMEGFEPDEFAKILGLPETLVPTALMTIGHANDTPRPKLRFSREELFFEKA